MSDNEIVNDQQYSYPEPYFETFLKEEQLTEQLNMLDLSENSIPSIKTCSDSLSFSTDKSDCNDSSLKASVPKKDICSLSKTRNNTSTKKKSQRNSFVVSESSTDDSSCFIYHRIIASEIKADVKETRSLKRRLLFGSQLKSDLFRPECEKRLAFDDGDKKNNGARQFTLLGDSDLSIGNDTSSKSVIDISEENEDRPCLGNLNSTPYRKFRLLRDSDVSVNTDSSFVSPQLRSNVTENLETNNIRSGKKKGKKTKQKFISGRSANITSPLLRIDLTEDNECATSNAEKQSNPLRDPPLSRKNVSKSKREILSEIEACKENLPMGDVSLIKPLKAPPKDRKFKSSPRKKIFAIHNQPVVLDKNVIDISDDESDVEIEKPSVAKPTTKLKKVSKKDGILKTPNTNCNINRLLENTSNTAQETGNCASFLASLSNTCGSLQPHPEAVRYKKSYNKLKHDLAKHLYALYNKEVFHNQLPQNLHMEWNARMRATSGFCYNNKRISSGSKDIIRVSRITLSSKVLTTADRLRDTLIHEMCHAATWLINGKLDGHGQVWQSWAAKAMRTFPELPAIKRCHDYDIKTKYVYRCVSCGYQVGRHTKSLDLSRKRCGRCYGKFKLLVNVTGPEGRIAVSPTSVSSKKVSGFALFVKENFSIVKKANSGMKHGAIMRLLGSQYATLKDDKQ